MSNAITGHLHHDNCHCGCGLVADLPGEIVQDSDTPKLAKFGLVYVRFEIPNEAGGRPTEKIVCYDLADVVYEQMELAA